MKIVKIKKVSRIGRNGEFVLVEAEDSSGKTRTFRAKKESYDGSSENLLEKIQVTGSPFIEVLNED